MKLKQGTFARNVDLLRLAGKVLVSEVKDRVRDLEVTERVRSKVELAKVLSGELGNLKGAAMKLGQMLSLDAADLLPPEALEVLGKLHRDAAPVEFAVIDAELQRALGERYANLVVEKTPLAVASIGQVHRAKSGAAELVLKVQFPGIAKTIEADIRLLRLLLGNTSFLVGKSVNFDRLFEELRSTLLAETDYQREGELLERARAHFAHDDRYAFPRWHREHSAPTVLALDFMPGIGFSDWLRLGPDEEERRRIGVALYELFLEEFLTLGLVQTDPNPGNFLVNSQGQLVVLDYGAAKEYDEEFRAGYKRLLRAAYASRRSEVLELSLGAGLLDPREDASVQEYYVDMMDWMVSPFRGPGPFDFNDEAYFQRAKDYAFGISKRCKYSPPPEQILFLHRKLGGVFQLLRRLELTLDVHSYWERYFAAGR